MFKRNKKLIARIESLETELGLVWSVDVDKFGCHQRIKNSYSILSKLEKEVERLGRVVTELTDKRTKGR